MSVPPSSPSRVGGERVPHSTLFERMATTQKKMAEVVSRLRSLRAADGCDETPSLDDTDPSVAHMLSVELCQLAASGDTVAVQVLLNCGADTDCRDYDERTPLHIASILGHVHVVRLLLEFGADPTLTDKDDKTALKLAEEHNQVEVVKLFQQQSELHRLESEISGDDKTPEGLSLDFTFMSGHPDFSQIPQPMMGGLIVIMVGLPGRAKKYISRQIQRYFQWNGLQTKNFLHSAYRERFIKEEAEKGIVAVVDESLPSEVTSSEAERRVAVWIAGDITNFILETDGVAVLYGSNCTPGRRMAVMNAIKKTGCIKSNRVVFVEVVNNDPEFVRQNVNHVKEMNPDASDRFIEEYYTRIDRLGSVYRTLDPTTDKHLTYIRVENQTTFALNNIAGWMPSRLAYMLHNLSHTPGNLYLTRAGEYVDLVEGRLGGNSRLTERGEAYSEALFEYFQKEVGMNSLVVMSSCALRCTETVRYFEEESALHRGGSSQSEVRKPRLKCSVAYLPTLDNVNYGDCDGQLVSDVRKTMPSTFLQMQADPYHTAWPNGECVHQLYNARLEPHIHDIQASTEPLLVVSHLPLLQGLHSYFVSENDKFVAPQDAYKIPIPFECVIKIRLVGINRIAETVDLSSEVDRIQMSRFGKLTKKPRQGMLDIFRVFAKK